MHICLPSAGQSGWCKTTLKFLLSAVRENTRVFDIMERKLPRLMRVGGMEND